MKPAPRVDVSGLPLHDFGTKSTMWWGTLGFIAIEATAFVAAIGAYYYLMGRADEWPMAATAPALAPGLATLAILLLSLWPNHLMSRAAHAEDKRRCQRLLVVMCALGLAAVLTRAWEFTELGVGWNENAYGSIVWALLGLHTLHLLTDFFETLLLTALMFTRHAHGKRFSDVGDDAFYWYFVVYSWAAIWLVLYGTPRL